MKTSDIQIRDPFILKDRHQYYLFGSTDQNIWRDAIPTGFDAYAGSDLENWEGPYAAFRPPEGFWGTKNFWAPEVHCYQGSYYMFATFYSEKDMRGTAILKSHEPTGPFEEWSNGAVTPKDWMCLDGTLYIDDENKPWMVFCHEWVQIENGTVCAVRLTEDLKEAIGEPVTLFNSHDAPWSKIAESKSNQIKGWVTDGCFLHRMKNGKLLMLWSCMGDEGYCIGYAISPNGKITGLWEQAQEPLFQKDGGHGMIFETYDGELMLSIHSPNNSPMERARFIPIHETENGLELISQ